MAHIAIDARIINSSTGRYVERLLHYLQSVDKTNRYTVLVRHKDLGFWQPVAPNFSVAVADFDNYSVAEQTKFNHFLKKMHVDLVHFCMPQQPILYKGSHVTTFHDLTLLKTYSSDKNWVSYHAKQLVGRYVFKRVLKSSKKIITDSDFTKKEVIEFSNTPEQKIKTIYLGAELGNDIIKSYPQPFKHYLLYVGQQSDYKNIKHLGEAHQQLLRQYPDLGLILVGKLNKSARLNQDYFEKHNFKNILFTDFVEDEQLNWLYAHAAVYVFPSLMEGFGLPPLEAMLHGTPVVSSNATCLPEIQGDAAYYFDPLDVSDMARAIDDVLKNEQLRLDLIKEGYKQVKKYSWKKMAEQTHKVYEDALKS
jgi:glycosyltransferase involved in cell wall biosynthesis